VLRNGVLNASTWLRAGVMDSSDALMFAVPLATAATTVS